MSKSYKNQSISDISLSLARRQVALRHGFEESTVKQANVDVGEYLSGGLKNLQEGAKTWWSNRDPVVQKALMGAGIGGAAGAGASLMRKNKRKHFLRDSLTGALGGGALFGGIGAVQDYKRLTDNVIGGNREKDQQLVEDARTAQEASSAGTGGLGTAWLNQISDTASDLSQWVNPHQKVEEATGGLVSPGASKTVADVAALGAAASATDQALGNLNTRLGGHVNTTEAQFLQLRRTAMEQAKNLRVPLHDTPIGIKLKQITNSTAAVNNLSAGNFNYFKDGVRKGVSSVPGFSGRSSASEVISFRDIVKAMSGESATTPSGSAVIPDKTMRVEVDQPLSRQVLQRVGEKPRFSDPNRWGILRPMQGKPQGWLNWLTRTSGTKGSRTARMPKSFKGKLGLGLGLLAWYLARRNQGATAAGKDTAEEIYRKYDESSE